MLYNTRNKWGVGMVTFEDIKDVFNKTNDIELSKIYTKRQKTNIDINKEACKEILLDFPCDASTVPHNYDDIEKINYLIIMYLNCGHPYIIKRVKEILHKYNYRLNSELLKTMQRTDFYFSGDIKPEAYQILASGAFSIKERKEITNKHVLLGSTIGDINIYPLDTYFGFERVDTSKRRGFCHNLTSDILKYNFHLYGAYYYIPFEFKGYMEHSVLIDPTENLVLDFANNIVVPFDIWQKYYNAPTICINGKDFNELSKRCKDELDINLTTCTLDSVRRIRKKSY